MSDITAIKENGAWCIVPWVHLFVGEDGCLRVCCQTLGDSSAVNNNAHGNAHTIFGGEGIEAAWNSDYMRNLRLAMVAGKSSSICRRCLRDEEVGIQSYRQDMNHLFDRWAAPALAQTGQDGWVSGDHIRSVDIRLGNQCNLRCRCCSPASTKGLIQDFAALHGVPFSDPRLDRFKNIHWPSEAAFWTTLEKYLPQIERLQFAGGEPLLVDQGFDFLERIVESGRAPYVTLGYVSNLTVLPRRAFELWPHFGRVAVTVSLDGFGAVNSLLRYPSDWATLDQNFHTLDQAAPRLKATNDLGFNTTVQVQNIFRLDEVLEYAAESFEYFCRPKLSLLHLPRHFNIKILPRELKEAAADRLRRFTESFQNRWPDRWKGDELDDLLNSIEGVIAHMMSEDWEDSLPEFRRWTEYYDRTRGQSTAQVIPELAPILSSAGADPSARQAPAPADDSKSL